MDFNAQVGRILRKENVVIAAQMVKNVLKWVFLLIHTLIFNTAPATKPFFLKTAAEVPFCLYNYQVVLHLYRHPKSEEQQGYLYITINGSKGKIQKIGLNSNLLKVTHPGTYDFLLTNAIDVGEIKDIEFDWDYVSTITSPSTWEVKKKLFGYGIKLFVENIKINQMDITDSRLKIVPVFTHAAAEENDAIPKDDAIRNFHPIASSLYVLTIS
ncbi:Endothelial lipase [Nymphon striatum]|nr:Endothelial lipase [Nymphon striatum]